MNRRGVTLVELCVVIVIILTLAAMLIPAVTAARSSRDKRQEPPQSWNLYTAQHDGHWFVKDAGGGVCHHPDCPCHSRTPEKTQ